MKTSTLHFPLSRFLLGFVNDSVTKSIVALRLTVVVKASTCVPGAGQASDVECSGKGRCTTKPSEVRGPRGDVTNACSHKRTVKSPPDLWFRLCVSVQHHF